jgi:hypothetical protein
MILHARTGVAGRRQLSSRPAARVILLRRTISGHALHAMLITGQDAPRASPVVSPRLALPKPAVWEVPPCSQVRARAAIQATPRTAYVKQ